jgi:hypothetical protein
MHHAFAFARVSALTLHKPRPPDRLGTFHVRVRACVDRSFDRTWKHRQIRENSRRRLSRRPADKLHGMLCVMCCDVLCWSRATRCRCHCWPGPTHVCDSWDRNWGLFQGVWGAAGELGSCKAAGCTARSILAGCPTSAQMHNLPPADKTRKDY